MSQVWRIHIETVSHGEQEASTAAAVDGLQTMKNYHDPSQASSFSSPRKLQNAALKRGYPTENVRDWLLRQDTYTLHKPARKSFPRNNVGDLWELADMI
jgi:hypothetical protein